MKRIKRYSVLLALFASLISPSRAEAQYALAKSVFGNSSTPVSSPDHGIAGTLAQPTIGETASPDHIMHVGFWYVVDRFRFYVGPITAPLDPLAVDTEIHACADFTDPDLNNTHTAVWDWGDNNTSTGLIDEAAGSVSGTHTYTSAGVFTVTLTVSVTNNAGISGQSTFRYVVIYDASAGFVTGGGWIDSPEGAYIPDPELTGKANFGFVSKYKKGQSTPTGQTEFRFKTAGLNFHSGSYDWLVITKHKAMYKGTGEINKSGNYGFQLTAIDADRTPSTDVDLFRIRIWNKDNGDGLVYDNKVGENDPNADPTTEIGGGNIKIHDGKATKVAENGMAETPDIPETYGLAQNYPNPFNPTTEIHFQLPEANHVGLYIYNTLGQKVRTLAARKYEAGFHSLRWDGTDDGGNTVSSGIYFFRIQAGNFSQVNKMSMLR